MSPLLDTFASTASPFRLNTTVSCFTVVSSFWITTEISEPLTIVSPGAGDTDNTFARPVVARTAVLSSTTAPLIV